MPHLYLLPTNFIAASVRSISTKLPTSRGFLSPSTESSTGMIFVLWKPPQLGYGKRLPDASYPDEVWHLAMEKLTFPRKLGQL